MINNVNILELVAYFFNRDITLDVADTIFLKLIVEDAFYFLGLARVLLIPHNDRKKGVIFILFAFKKGKNDLLELLVLHIRYIDLEL
jgi:hypothetical protein